MIASIHNFWNFFDVVFYLFKCNISHSAPSYYRELSCKNKISLSHLYLTCLTISAPLCNYTADTLVGSVGTIEVLQMCDW